MPPPLTFDTIPNWRPFASNTRASSAISSRGNLRRSWSLVMLFREHQFGDRLELHVRSAFVNLADFGIPEILLDGIILYEAGAAKDLYRQRTDALGDLRGEQLGHGSLLHKVLARILHAGGVVYHEPRGLNVSGHLRQLELDALKIGDRLAKLLALLRVLGRG